MQNMRNEAHGPGAVGFPKAYWDENYAEPETMDGIYDARRRAVALKAIFDAEYVEIGSLIDFGFGLGHLFREMVDVFLPYTAVGIEPSRYVFDQLTQQQLTAVESVDVTLLPMTLLAWCRDESQRPTEPFDLGICTSVIQYMSDPELKEVIPVLAQRLKYLYLTVPTDVEFRYQREVVDFTDKYAISRSQEEYLELLRGHFTIVGNRVLESNVHFDVNTTFFADLFYRF